MKKLLLPLVLCIGLASSSCLGPDHLYNSIKNWNAGLSDKDWVNEIVFLGLTIIPVYPIALLGDVVIFNTVGYWSGDGLVKDPGPFPGFTRKDSE
jgi:hypothetical protein